jgi:hypothetical protein
MPPISNFILTLDTTPPQDVVILLDDGAATTANDLVNVKVSTSDVDTTGYQMKVWDDSIDESIAVWEAYQPSRGYNVPGGDGLKTYYAKLRDDVGNESPASSDTIEYNTAAPTITITADPTRTKVSKVTGWSETSFSFASNMDIDVYSVRVVPNSNSSHLEGTEIGTAFGSLRTSGGPMVTNVPMAVILNGADVEAASPGDGDKVVKVFGKTATGLWSS